MNIREYIESGIIEEYVLGLAEEEERTEFETLLSQYPVLQQALNRFELQLEEQAMQNQIPPPAELKQEIMDRIDRLPVKIPEQTQNFNGKAAKEKSPYISVYEVSSTHIKVHKYWRVAFLIVFILSKIFLGLMVYFAIKYHEAKLETQHLKERMNTEVIQK